MIPIYTIVNDAQRPLLDEFLRPSVSRACGSNSLTVFDAPSATGDYMGKGYLDVIKAKVRTILETLGGEDREVVIWTDVDIVFLGGATVSTAIDELGEGCIAFQQDLYGIPHVNGGFFVARRCREARATYERILAALHDPANCFHEQEHLNHLVDAGLRLQRLSPKFLANSYLRSAKREMTALPAGTLLFHANLYCTVPDKQAALRYYTAPRRGTGRVWPIRYRRPSAIN